MDEGELVESQVYASFREVMCALCPQIEASAFLVKLPFIYIKDRKSVV